MGLILSPAPQFSPRPVVWKALIQIFFFPFSLFIYIYIELPNSEAENDVIVSKCSEMEKKDEDMKCAHGFLKKIRHPSANCRFVSTIFFNKLIYKLGVLNLC